jgi:DNA modification methylase
MPKRPFINRLNDLTPKSWLKFQKSWFIHTPPRRRKDVLQHPAKFPESLVQEFIEFFTKRDQVVFDPMVGTGSTLVGALRAGRHSYGIELNSEYANIASNILAEERKMLGETANDMVAMVITGDSSHLSNICVQYKIPLINYVITSPPYWDMLKVRGAKTQAKRRSSASLDVFYSDNPFDLGNISSYDEFLERLVNIYKCMKPHLQPRAYITIIVKNIKKGSVIYPLAWDLGRELGNTFTLKDERIWCQDDIRLAPYGMGNAWVSNTFHHYCLQFRNE